MGKLKTYRMKLEHKKVVQNSGRCYNFVEGKGWNHYTKGFRKHTSRPETLEKGTLFLFSFLDRTMPKTEEVKEGE